MNLNSKIYVAGHLGMAGSAIMRSLIVKGYNNIVVRTHYELDLCDQKAVSQFFSMEKPEEVYFSAAKVGGIHANNTFPAEFIYQNLMMQSNVIHQSFLHGVKKILFLGSSCVYPRMADQPINENALLSGKLEATNEPYSIAKIAGIKLCESYNRQYGESHGIDYRSVVPTNLFGPGDDYYSQNSHVIPALITRFHEAKVNLFTEVIIWGTGNPRREFLYVDDMAEASIFVMQLNKTTYLSNTEPMQGHINVGFGSDFSIKDLAMLIAKVVGYSGYIRFDTSRSDGAPRKLINSSKINLLGWQAQITLEDGLHRAYKDFLEKQTRRSPDFL